MIINIDDVRRLKWYRLWSSRRPHYVPKRATVICVYLLRTRGPLSSPVFYFLDVFSFLSICESFSVFVDQPYVSILFRQAVSEVRLHLIASFPIPYRACEYNASSAFASSAFNLISLFFIVHLLRRRLIYLPIHIHHISSFKSVITNRSELRILFHVVVISSSVIVKHSHISSARSNVYS
jgi:hypothetical protein